MDNGRIIIGAGVLTIGVLVIRNVLEQGETRAILRPVIGTLIATSLLAALAAIGLGAIAAPLAVLLATTVIILYGFGLLETVKGYL